MKCYTHVELEQNPYSESTFKTAKYRPDYPDKPFASLAAAAAWAARFVEWYDDCHFHSCIRFVTPADRHAQVDVEILEQRHRV